MQAVCAGFVYAIDIADAMIQSGRGRRALVVGAESFSKLLIGKTGLLVSCLAMELVQWFWNSLIILMIGGSFSVLHSDGAYRDILYGWWTIQQRRWSRSYGR